jgi:hypothetical protein
MEWIDGEQGPELISLDPPYEIIVPSSGPTSPIARIINGATPLSIYASRKEKKVSSKEDEIKMRSGYQQYRYYIDTISFFHHPSIATAEKQHDDAVANAKNKVIRAVTIRELSPHMYL